MMIPLNLRIHVHMLLLLLQLITMVLIRMRMWLRMVRRKLEQHRQQRNGLVWGECGCGCRGQCGCKRRCWLHIARRSCQQGKQGGRYPHMRGGRAVRHHVRVVVAVAVAVAVLGLWWLLLLLTVLILREMVFLSGGVSCHRHIDIGAGTHSNTGAATICNRTWPRRYCCCCYCCCHTDQPTTHTSRNAVLHQRPHHPDLDVLGPLIRLFSCNRIECPPMNASSWWRRRRCIASNHITW
mmetsp:Transcript_20620/g.58651  ORF Transcript_20620/g.58651 Transcript_20620/m.58651 type:complete len:238 (-) Transcript_20620:244-957(-)